MTFALLSFATGPLGYLALGGLVGVESLGIPVPGEAALDEIAAIFDAPQSS